MVYRLPSVIPSFKLEQFVLSKSSDGLLTAVDESHKRSLAISGNNSLKCSLQNNESGIVNSLRPVSVEYNFYLMHLKIAMNYYMFRLARVWVHCTRFVDPCNRNSYLLLIRSPM